jgi:hypothetical protein
VEVNGEAFEVQNKHTFTFNPELHRSRTDTEMLVEDSTDSSWDIMSAIPGDYEYSQYGEYAELSDFVGPSTDSSITTCADSYAYAFRGATQALKSFLEATEAKTLNNQDSIGGTLLFWAVVGKNPETVRMLLSFNADPNIPNFAGESPLHLAAELDDNFLDIVDALVSSGANVNSQTMYRDTPLHYARHSSNITEFLAHISDRQIVNQEGHTYQNWPPPAIVSPFRIRSRYEVGRLFFTQTKHPNFLKSCMGMFPPPVWERLRREAKSILMNIPEQIDLFNSLLVGDQEFTEEMGMSIKRAKSVAGVSTPKWSKLCYFSAQVTPIEVWDLAYMGYFYIPTFVMAKTDPRDIPGNVLFEIDLSPFPQFSTMLDQDTVLLSCYNIFQYSGFRLERETGQVVVRLNIVNYFNKNPQGHVLHTGDGRASDANPAFSTLLNESFAYVQSTLPAEQFALTLEQLFNVLKFTPPLDPNPNEHGEGRVRVLSLMTIPDESGVVDSLLTLKYPVKDVAQALVPQATLPQGKLARYFLDTLKNLEPRCQLSI